MSASFAHTHSISESLLQKDWAKERGEKTCYCCCADTCEIGSRFNVCVMSAAQQVHDLRLLMASHACTDDQTAHDGLHQGCICFLQ